jgi:hypothetical protein
MLFSLLFSSCEDYLGEETDLSFIEVPQTTFREVAYVPVQPILNQFSSPSDIIAGFDELIYVVDSATQEVIALDESGRELGRKFVQGARAIAQDRRLDLLVIGSVNDAANVRSCIYRFDLSSNNGYGLQYAVATDTVIHPYYFRNNPLSQDLLVNFNRITILSDNSYYVSRSGPNNSGLTPDDAILLFDDNDRFITPITISNQSGAQFNDYFKKPFGITSLAKPPQISVDQRNDFVYTSLDPNGVLKVQYIQNLSSIDGSAYLPKTDWSADTALADNFINEPFRFKQPVGVEFTGDGSNYIFVVDRASDSLYQFTSNGLEGVQPPPASGRTKYVNTSFGGTGIGPTQFNSPSAVAYKDEILYVADQGNGRILRFKLTLDIR